MPTLRDVVRNARLLLHSAAQHLVDDPALLAVQVSRRLPFRLRVGAGKALVRVAGTLPAAVPGGAGTAALGAYMAGDLASAQSLIAGTTAAGSRIGGEVARDPGPHGPPLRAVRPDHPSPRRVDTRRPQRGAADPRRRRSGDLAVCATAAQRAPAARARASSDRHTGPRRRPRRRHPRPVLCGTGDRLRVLHILTNSLPHTQSGYSLAPTASSPPSTAQASTRSRSPAPATR